MSDPEIVGVTSAANSAEIQAGTLAQSKAASASVRDFAAMMVACRHLGQAEDLLDELQDGELTARNAGK